MADENLTDEAAESDAARHEKAARIISSSVAWSAASGVVPVPVLDLIALGGVQTKMILDLSQLYGRRARGELAPGLVSVLLGTLLPAGATGAIAGSAAKLIPGWSWVVGMTSQAAFGAAATYAMGKVFVHHFEGGGSLANFNAKAVQEELKAEFSKAKTKQTAAA
jgi:uncharacterized protein (DUF697 family)